MLDGKTTGITFDWGRIGVRSAAADRAPVVVGLAGVLDRAADFPPRFR